MKKLKTRLGKTIMVMIMTIILISSFSFSAFAAGPTNLYQETITLYSAGYGQTQGVIFNGSNIHVAAKLVSAPIPDGTIVNVFLEGNGKSVFLFRLASNGDTVSTTTPVSIVSGRTYYVVLYRYGAGYLPPTSQVSIGCSSY